MNQSPFVITLAIALAVFSSSAMAEFSIDELQEASKQALESFQTDNPDHVKHFTGYKAWKSEEDAKVRVYVTHDKMNMNYDYQCHKHDKDIECHAE